MHPGDVVKIKTDTQKNWTSEGFITGDAGIPRSYTVDTDSGTYIRNRRHLQNTGTTRIEPDNQDAGTTRIEPDNQVAGTTRIEPDNQDAGTTRIEPDNQDAGQPELNQITRMLVQPDTPPVSPGIKLDTSPVTLRRSTRAIKKPERLIEHLGTLSTTVIDCLAVRVRFIDI